MIELLSVGERKSRGEADAVAAMVSAEPTLLPTLINITSEGNATVRAHGITAVRSLFEQNATLLHPHKTTILERLVPIEQWEVRSELCHILPSLPLTSSERHDLFAALKGWRGDKSKIVQAWAISALFHLSAQDETLSAEMSQILSEVDSSAPPSVKARVRQLLNEKS